MKSRVPHMLVLAGSLVGVLSVAMVDMGRTAPGKVTRVHAAVDSLKDGTNCNACHGSWFESMGDACLECHEVIVEQIEQNSGLHGRLADVEADRCNTCHSEHHGAQYRIVNQQSFVHAGIPDPAHFDHDLVGFDMQGAHLQLECIECHEFADQELIPEGERRYIGLSSQCASCHEDPHEGSMRQACDNCHDQGGFETQHFDRHADFFPLVGSHGEGTCLDCHDPQGPHSIAAQMAGETDGQTRACTACHDSPHRERFLLGNALAMDHAKNQSCSGCHDAIHGDFRGDTGAMSPEEHAFSGFALDGPHANLECAACHNSDAQRFQNRYPGRAHDDCAQCHQSPHGDQFVGDPFSDNKCIACHDQAAFMPHAFDAEKHGRVAIELSGTHGTLECDACHETLGPEQQMRFRGTPNRCELCHDDAHDQYFTKRLAKRSTPDAGECGICHSTTNFTEIPEGRFQHGSWTGFELLGAHAQNRCESCHERSPEIDENGRSFGWIAERFGPVQDCATCHVDPHAGHFDRKQGQAETEGGRACLRCHEESSFRTLPHGFNHKLWTGFPLEGAHAEASCTACHSSVVPHANEGQDEGKRSTAPGTRCSSCHADPHASQFVVNGQVDCERCHKTSLDFSDLRFRHDLDSRFPLEQQHAALACAACHKSIRVGDRKVVRYRPLGINCADCHGVHEDVLRKRRGNR